MSLSYKDIATIINTQIMKNATGDNSGTLIAEDLSNLVEVGTVVNASNAIDMRNAINSLVVGIHNFVLAREIETRQFKLFRTKEEYGGGIQRIMATKFHDAKSTSYHNLQSGTDYTDGKFYGTEASAVVYENTEDFKVPVSYSEAFFSTWFSDAAELAKWANLVAITEKNTIKKYLYELEKRIIVKIAAESVKDGRKIVLVDLFNAMEGRTETSGAPTLTNNVKWTISEIKKYRDEWAYFGSFCKECVANIVDYVREPNKKYNDGTTITYAPTSKVGVVMLTQFANDIKYLGTPVEYNPVDMDFETIPYWQSGGSAMLPDYSIAAAIKTTDKTDNTYNNVVGLIYDIEGAGITVVDDSVSYKPVPEEKFATTFHFLSNKYYIDKRLSAVSIILA